MSSITSFNVDEAVEGATYIQQDEDTCFSGVGAGPKCTYRTPAPDDDGGSGDDNDLLDGDDDGALGATNTTTTITTTTATTSAATTTTETTTTANGDADDDRLVTLGQGACQTADGSTQPHFYKSSVTHADCRDMCIRAPFCEGIFWFAKDTAGRNKNQCQAYGHKINTAGINRNTFSFFAFLDSDGVGPLTQTSPQSSQSNGGECEVKTDDRTTTITTATLAAATTTTATDDALPSLVGLVTSVGDLSTLLAAVGSADLVETLTNAGTYTVFAPTNAAFAAIPALELAALLADKERLKQVILNHVLASQVLSTELMDGEQMVETATGGALWVTKTADGVTVANSDRSITASVVAADNIANNGVAHTINAVLLPADPSSTTTAPIATTNTDTNTTTTTSFAPVITTSATLTNTTVTATTVTTVTTKTAAGDVCGCQSYRNNADKYMLSMCKSSAGECSPLQSDGMCSSDHERCPTTGTSTQATTTAATTVTATTTVSASLMTPPPLELVEVENDVLFVRNDGCTAIAQALDSLLFGGRSVLNETCVGHVDAFDGNANDGYDISKDDDEANDGYGALPHRNSIDLISLMPPPSPFPSFTERMAKEQSTRFLSSRQQVRRPRVC